MDHRDGHRPRDERRRPRSRSKTRLPYTSTKSRGAEDPRSNRRTSDDRHYEETTAPESSRRQQHTEATYRDSNRPRRDRSPRAKDGFYQKMQETDFDTEPDGRDEATCPLTLENLQQLPGKSPEIRTRSMIGKKRNVIPVPVDCLEIKPKPRRQDSSGDKKRIMPAPVESTRTLVHRPASRRDSVPSRANSPEQPRSSRRGDRQSREAETRQKGAYLPDDTRPSQADYTQGSRKKHRERRSPSPPIPSL